VLGGYDHDLTKHLRCRRFFYLVIQCFADNLRGTADYGEEDALGGFRVHGVDNS
jgi:hypothetical protein